MKLLCPFALLFNPSFFACLKRNWQKALNFILQLLVFAIFAVFTVWGFPPTHSRVNTHNTTSTQGTINSRFP